MGFLSRADVLTSLSIAADQAKLMHVAAEAIRRKSAVLAEIEGETIPVLDRDELGRAELTLGATPASFEPGS